MQLFRTPEKSTHRKNSNLIDNLHRATYPLGKQFKAIKQSLTHQTNEISCIGEACNKQKKHGRRKIYIVAADARFLASTSKAGMFNLEDWEMQKMLLSINEETQCIFYMVRLCLGFGPAREHIPGQPGHLLRMTSKQTIQNTRNTLKHIRYMFALL